MAMVLEGIRVTDWTAYVQGPVATMLLGDLGADVIKIEERIKGDPARGLMRIASAMLSTNAGDRNVWYEISNRNKRCITLDLKKQEGKEIVYRLVRESDVFVQNFRVGVAERMGMDYETLCRYNPSLIYAHSSGWGPKGPDRAAPSMDYSGQARSGIMTLVGEPDMDPQLITGGIADQLAGLVTAFGILAALRVRERTGMGQKVDVSLLGSMHFLLGNQLSLETMVPGLSGRRLSRKRAGNPLWNHYKCGDGKWIALAHMTPDPFWPALCSATGLQDLEKDPRFDTMDHRSDNCEELVRILDETFATRTRQEWERTFGEHGMIFSPVNTIKDATEDVQALANNYITDYNHPMWGRTRVVGFPVALSKTPCSIWRAPPEFGQHTEEILVDMLGYSWDDITRLKKKEVI